MSTASDTLSTYNTSVLELLLPREGVADVDLRPAGDAGKHLVAARLTRRVPIQIVDEQRPRADQTHVTAHHVPELRQLIKTQCAQHAAERGEPLGIRQPTFDQLFRSLQNPRAAVNAVLGSLAGSGAFWASGWPGRAPGSKNGPSPKALWALRRAGKQRLSLPRRASRCRSARRRAPGAADRARRRGVGPDA